MEFKKQTDQHMEGGRRRKKIKKETNRKRPRRTENKLRVDEYRWEVDGPDG